MIGNHTLMYGWGWGRSLAPLEFNRFFRGFPSFPVLGLCFDKQKITTKNDFVVEGLTSLLMLRFGEIMARVARRLVSGHLVGVFYYITYISMFLTTKLKKQNNNNNIYIFFLFFLEKKCALKMMSTIFARPPPPPSP
jgi:hypothetical protein